MDGLRQSVAFGMHVFVWMVIFQPVAPYAGCPKGWLKHSRKCYVIIPPTSGGQTYETASQVCRDRGGELMNPKTDELINMATVLLRGQGGRSAFIGLNDRNKEGDYRWGDGSEARGLKWKTGDRNDANHIKDCANLYISGEFNDNECDKVYATLAACEKTAKEHIVVPPTKRKNCKGKKTPDEL